jgi:hypothetical protein
MNRFTMYLVNHTPLPKLIICQASPTFLDGEASRARKNPLVTLFETDTAIAFCDGSQFRDLDAEFEGAAVAVSCIGLELLSGIWFCH